VGVDLIVAESAYRHGVSDEDIRHAYANPIRVFDLDEGFMMIIGANLAAISARSASSKVSQRPLSCMP